MYLRSIKHVCKNKTSDITRETCASENNTRASARARKCVKKQSNSDCGCTHIQRTLTSPEDDVLTSIKHVCKCMECKHPPPQSHDISKRKNMLKDGPLAKTCKFPTAGSPDVSKNNRVSKKNMHVFLRSFHLLTNDFLTSKWDNLTLTVVQLRDPGTSLDTKSMRSVHQRKNVH